MAKAKETKDKAVKEETEKHSHKKEEKAHKEEHSHTEEHAHKEHEEGHEKAGKKHEKEEHASHEKEHAKKEKSEVHHKPHETLKHHEGHHEKGSKPFDWIEYKPKEIEEAIINLANSAIPPSEIGLILRDQYGIPNVKKFSTQRVQEILAKHKLLGEIPEDLLNLIRKSVRLDRHLSHNKKDMSAKLGLQLTVSKIRRLTEYYHRAKKLPKDWHYSPEKAALLTK